MPRPKIRPISLDEVKISREGDFAIFTYANETMGGGMNLKIGPEVVHMTDDELLKRHNEIAHSILHLAKNGEYVGYAQWPARRVNHLKLSG